MPLSMTLMTTSEPAFSGEEIDPAAFRGVLGGIIQKVGQNLGQPRGVDFEHDSDAPEAKSRARACNHRAEAARLHGQLDDAVELDRLFLEHDRSTGDPGNIEEVVDDPGHVLDLLGDDVDRPTQIGAVRPFDAHDLNGVADGRQRVPQLVGEHGEEMVLALIGVAKRFLHSLSVVDVGDDRANAQDRAVGSLDRVEAAKPASLAAGASRCHEGDLPVDDALASRKHVLERFGEAACQRGKGFLKREAQVFSRGQGRSSRPGRG